MSGTRWRQAIFCRMNDGRVTGRFSFTCSEKHEKEMKIQDASLVEEGHFPCKL